MLELFAPITSRLVEYREIHSTLRSLPLRDLSLQGLVLRRLVLLNYLSDIFQVLLLSIIVVMIALNLADWTVTSKITAIALTLRAVIVLSGYLDLFRIQLKIH